MRKSGWMVVTMGCLAVSTLVHGGFVRAGTTPEQGQAPAQPKAPAGNVSPHKAGTTSPYDRVLLRPALLTAKAPAAYKVKFSTTKGDFVISVTREWAPLGADRFYNLARHHFYDSSTFFRVHAGFVVQWGISAYPPVTAAWEHAPIKDDPVVKSNLRGFVTYAKTSQPDTRTTQVFINLVDNQSLDTMGGFAPFGQVTEGMEVVDALYAGYGETPDQDSINKSGKAYLDKNFPNLDSTKTTTLILPEGAAPAKKTAPAAAKTTPVSEKQP